MNKKSDRKPEIWPAPMEGVMTQPLIRAASKLGLVDRWMTPFWRVTSSPVKKSKLKQWFAPFVDSGLPVTAQLMGEDAEMITRVAEELLRFGASDINLNFGCPSGQVVRHGCGGGMLKRIKDLILLFARVKKSLAGVPVGIKIRSGFDEINLAWLQELSLDDSDKIFFHYRLVKEAYLPFPFKTALRRFAEVRNVIPNSWLIANGDIDTLSKMTDVLKLGFDGIMTGRGWFRNPSLLMQMTGICPAQTDEHFWRKELFLNTLIEVEKDDFFTFSRGNAIELAILIWGAGNPVFQRLIKNDGKVTDDATLLRSMINEFDELLLARK